MASSSSSPSSVSLKRNVKQKEQNIQRQIQTQIMSVPTFLLFEQIQQNITSDDSIVLNNFLPTCPDLFKPIFDGTRWFNNTQDNIEYHRKIMWILAGFIDGDGCLSVNDRANKTRYRFDVDQHLKDVQAVYLPFLWFRLGNISSSTNSNGSIIRKWFVGKDSVWITEQLKPFFQIKKLHSELYTSTSFLAEKDPCLQTNAISSNFENHFRTLQEAVDFLQISTDLIKDIDSWERGKFRTVSSPEDTSVKLIRWINSNSHGKQVKYYQVLVIPTDRYGEVVLTAPSQKAMLALLQTPIGHTKLSASVNGRSISAADHVFWCQENKHDRDLAYKSTLQQKRDVGDQIRFLNHSRPMNRIDETKIPDEYFAGLFAAEGSIFAQNKTGACLSIGQKYPAILHAIQRKYNLGTIYDAGIDSATHYNWTISNINEAHHLMEIWKPFLITKLRDYQAVLDTIGLDYRERQIRVHEAREANLPEKLKTEFIPKKRRITEEDEDDEDQTNVSSDYIIPKRQKITTN